MICSEEVFYIGKVSKFRGIQGEVEILFTDDAFDRGDAEYLVLEMEGILVPFFWEEYRFKNDKTAIFQFEDIHDETAARLGVAGSAQLPIEPALAALCDCGNIEAFEGGWLDDMAERIEALPAKAF